MSAPQESSDICVKNGSRTDAFLKTRSSARPRYSSGLCGNGLEVLPLGSAIYACTWREGRVQAVSERGQRIMHSLFGDWAMCRPIQ